MTPAINILKKNKIKFNIHEYEHDSSEESFGEEAAKKLGATPEAIFKTLVTTDGKDFFVGVVPVLGMLDLKSLAKAVGAKKLVMADKSKVEAMSGYIVGGVSPLGQKKRLKTIIDASAQELSTMYVSGGRRGLDIELEPKDLAKLLNAKFFEIAKEGKN